MDLKLTEIKIPEKSERKYREYTSRRSYSLPRKETPYGKSRVWVSCVGENIWDDLENRTSRPHTLWAPLIKKALEDAWGVKVALRWSQKAGCSCPCSPAFFVTGGPLGLDIQVKIEADAPQTVNPELAAFRGAQVAAQL